MSSHLRVQGGELGGRRLQAPKGIRPSQGVVKEAIFNILGAAVEGAAVLDLFAGSGALGIEALSRGAASALFVDSDQDAIQSIHHNVAALALDNRARVQRAHVGGWLGAHRKEVAEARLIFLDPPYNDPALFQALSLLDDLAGPGAAVVVEHAARTRLPAMRRLGAGGERRYGDTAVTFLAAPAAE